MMAFLRGRVFETSYAYNMTQQRHRGDFSDRGGDKRKISRHHVRSISFHVNTKRLIFINQRFFFHFEQLTRIS